jgi:hypothetical protein
MEQEETNYGDNSLPTPVILCPSMPESSQENPHNEQCHERPSAAARFCVAHSSTPLLQRSTRCPLQTKLKKSLGLSGKGHGLSTYKGKRHNEMRARLDFATGIVQEKNGAVLQDASLRIAVVRMHKTPG